MLLSILQGMMMQCRRGSDPVYADYWGCLGLGAFFRFLEDGPHEDYADLEEAWAETVPCLQAAINSVSFRVYGWTCIVVMFA